MLPLVKHSVIKTDLHNLSRPVCILPLVVLIGVLHLVELFCSLKTFICKHNFRCSVIKKVQLELAESVTIVYI